MAADATGPERSNNDDQAAWADAHVLSRRGVLGLGVVAATGTIAMADGAHAAPPPAGFALLSEAEIATPYPHVHGGDGTVSVRFFQFDQAPAPANFVIYDMPPGSSEGVHTHHLGDTINGPFDEYYYIIAGAGAMEIDGRVVPVKAGDHVHTPLGVAHGVRNTSADQPLRIFLTFITRTA